MIQFARFLGGRSPRRTSVSLQRNHRSSAFISLCTWNVCLAVSSPITFAAIGNTSFTPNEPPRLTGRVHTIRSVPVRAIDGDRDCQHIYY